MAAESASSAAEARVLLEDERLATTWSCSTWPLPAQDGLDLARRVRADRELADLRLLAADLGDRRLDPAELRDAGVDEVLSKPVMSSLLRRSLLHLLTGEPMDPAVQGTGRPRAPSRARG